MIIAINPPTLSNEFLSQMEAYGIQKVYIGNDDVSIYHAHDVDRKQLKSYCETYPKLTFSYMCNALFHTAELEGVYARIREVISYGVREIQFHDVGLLHFLKEQQKLYPDLTFSWNGEMIGTNSYTGAFYLRQGVDSIAIPKELTLNEQRKISQALDGAISIQIYGFMPMFYSRRTLITNYLEKYGEKVSHTLDFYMLRDNERAVHYPITETARGTHIYSSFVSSLMRFIPQIVALEANEVRIDGNFHSEELFKKSVETWVTLLEMYRTDKAAFESENKERISVFEDALYRELRFQTKAGFLYKETVY